MNETSEQKPAGWWKMSLLGWVVHVVLGAGVFTRLVVGGPYYQQRYAEFNLKLPWLTEQVFHGSSWLMRGTELDNLILGVVALVDLGMLILLARTDRTLWHGWFWGIVILLLLLLLVVQYALLIPEWKLREALSRTR